MSKGKPKIRYVMKGGELAEVRLMAEADGYSMVRRKGCIPFVVMSKELLASIPNAPVARGGFVAAHDGLNP